MREKLRKYGSDILYYSLSFIATLIVWLAHDLDRIGVLKEVDFALELMWWLILMLFAWAGELLPVEETTPDTPLRVGWSPLYEEPRLAKQLGLKKLWVKDDGQNPTASLKDRASAMAVAKAGEAGAKIIACSSTGNAASSLAGNAAAAGLKTFIFVPERAPKGKVAQLMTFGANVISVKGNYEETFELSKKAIDKWGWYNRNAAINPYLSEGKKTVSLEIAEQLEWKMPDYLAISVGDGCTIAGVWKGFKDLYAVGLIDKLPRLISAQAEGCHPINRAIAEDKPWEPMEENTLADRDKTRHRKRKYYLAGMCRHGTNVAGIPEQA